MELDEAIRLRRSVRAFLPRPVPDDTLREVFALAQGAPSNCNTQPWIAHLISGESLHRLGATMDAAAIAGVVPDPDFPALGDFSGLYRSRQVEAAVALYGAMGIERQDRAGRDAAFRRNLRAFDAPHAVFVFMAEGFAEREAVDLGIYAQTLMLALTARGIGSCAQGALSLYPDIVRRHLGIAPASRLLFGIAFGYEDPEAPANATRTERAPVELAVTFHQ